MPRPRSLRSLAVSTSRPTTAATHPGPPSPTFSATTQASAMALQGGPGVIITRADLRASLQAYEDLVSASATYRKALINLSEASAGFASAIESCSRLKGTDDETSVGLQAAAGLHYLIANQEQVLSDSINQNFDKPLRQHLEEYRKGVTERSAAYEQALVEKSRIIRETEAENMNIGRRKLRDLNSFRAALTILQAQVNELDRLKGDYYSDVLAHESQVWGQVLGKVSLVVRSSIDVYDRISAKSSDPILEPLLQAIPDPFDSYGPPKPEDQIFSILPPLATIMSQTGSNAAPSPVMSTPDLESAPALNGSADAGGTGSSVQSWMNQTQPYFHDGADWTTSSRGSSASPPAASTFNSGLSAWTSNITKTAAAMTSFTFSPARRYSHPPSAGSSPARAPQATAGAGPSTPTSPPSNGSPLGMKRPESKLRTSTLAAIKEPDNEDQGKDKDRDGSTRTQESESSTTRRTVIGSPKRSSSAGTIGKATKASANGSAGAGLGNGREYENENTAVWSSRSPVESPVVARTLNPSAMASTSVTSSPVRSFRTRESSASGVSTPPPRDTASPTPSTRSLSQSLSSFIFRAPPPRTNTNQSHHTGSTYGPNNPMHTDDEDDDEDDAIGPTIGYDHGMNMGNYGFNPMGAVLAGTGAPEDDFATPRIPLGTLTRDPRDGRDSRDRHGLSSPGFIRHPQPQLPPQPPPVPSLARSPGDEMFGRF
ncbi:hypothetical protein BOTBODRAFT_38683 [Botryobasidium botryosum FD-172 SS1]|uniref:IMD domain-containing protein n=1 Tax=Botryobasidium botryosum (strain FD-172 SS1) TaxID=930990 RepID=A0A067LWM9_BOTB1|nr:hypothetical protein BOTBODRAFT_38683 [Botryobasidium botryosum FD-172 SS1]